MTDWGRLIDRLDPPLDGETPIRHRAGTVTAVNGDGTIDVALGGVVVPGVATIGQAKVSQAVDLLVWRGDLLALGRAGPLGILAYAEVTADQTGIGSSATNLTGLSISATVGENRRIRIGGQVLVRQQTSTGEVVSLIRQSGVDVGRLGTFDVGATDLATLSGSAIIIPASAGTRTYNLTLQTNAGTVDALALSGRPNFILVEDIGAA